MTGLITDRTQEDVNFANANPGTGTPNKGAYNAEDFNRVGAALNYISDILYSWGYGVNLKLRTNWASNENMPYRDAVAYLDTVRLVKESFVSLPSTPPLPRHIHDLFHSLGFSHANNIERWMLDVEQLVANMIAAFRHSGTFYSGMEGLRV